MPDEKAPTTQPARAAVAIFGPDGKLQEANSFFWELTGYRAADLGVLALLDLIPPEELQHRPLRTREMENGRPLFSLRPLLRRDGTTRLVLARTQRMPGGRAQIVAWAVESGSPALLEEDGWTSLVGGLAHHLNGALTLIQGYSALLRERYPDAAEGEEALGHLRQDPDGCGLLLTDVLMPGMTGPQVAAEVRRLRPRLPVLYVSGHPADLVHPGEREAFLPKPFLPTELLQAVGALLSGT